DAAVSHFGRGVGTAQLDVLVRDAGEAVPRSDGRHTLLQAHATQVAHAVEDFARAAPTVLGLSSAGSTRLLPEQRERLSPLLQQLSTALGTLAAACREEDAPEIVNLARRASTLAGHL